MQSLETEIISICWHLLQIFRENTSGELVSGEFEPFQTTVRGHDRRCAAAAASFPKGYKIRDYPTV